MKLHIDIMELLIAPDMGLPPKTANKMLRYHIYPVNKVRDWLGAPVWASDRSGYRPTAWERQKGRAPDQSTNTRDKWSEHCFLKDSKGATDWTTKPEVMESFGYALYLMTDYTRISFYVNDLFFHCDYRFPSRGQRLFMSDENGWTELQQLHRFIDVIKNST